jgi:hypothetical protein
MNGRNLLNKFLIIGILALIIISVLNPIVIGYDTTKEDIPLICHDKSSYDDCLIIKKSIIISSPKIYLKNNYLRIHVNEETSQTVKPNKTLLPVVTQVFLLPFKTRIKYVNVSFNKVNEKKINHPICLAPETIPDFYTNIKNQIPATEHSNENQDSLFYPERPFNYHIHAGRYDDKIINYLYVNLYPVRYDSAKKTLYYCNEIDISIQYELQNNHYNFGDEYDLIIISPKKFAQDLQQLVDHKNSHGLRTKLVKLSEIYRSVHFPIKGRDKAEKVKYFIKQALDEWGIKYVLLFGGRKGGIFKPWWWVPARYSNIIDFLDQSFLSDLYFGDIYDSEGNFSTWDTNNNGIYGEWHSENKDIIDMFPEVYTGRLPCKNIEEARIVIDKIITYENTAYEEDWFHKFIGVAGDSTPEEGEPFFEGEIATEASYGYLDGFNATYLWTSTGAFKGKEDVVREVNKGCGFILFSGHGNPREWCTHPPYEKEIWISAPNAFEMDWFNNTEKLPIVVVGGCWNSKFSTGLLEILRGIITEGRSYFKKLTLPNGYYTYEWLPKCWSWSMASQNGGGCIAIIGNSGLGHGLPGEDCLSGKGRYLETLFFKSYSEGADMLGETHSNQQISYMKDFPPMENYIDCKIIQQLVLLGDPSLKIGGYPTN